jgi:predicted acylesterase/phospholipase RssA
MGGDGKLGLVLTGGGARAAYQVGFIRSLARAMPHLEIPIITGVSAGAINAVFLAAHTRGLPTAADEHGPTRLEIDVAGPVVRRELRGRE